MEMEMVHQKKREKKVNMIRKEEKNKMYVEE
jgi:hypothetical protein